MPLSLSELIARRPYLYHLTARQNLTHIFSPVWREGRGVGGVASHPGARGRLVSAAELIIQAGRRVELLRTRRVEHVTVAVPDGIGGSGAKAQVVLRDQKPLHAGNIAFTGGYNFEQLLVLLNSLVFFWPGTERGPSDYGRRHFARYAREDCVVLRVPFAALAAVNPEVVGAGVGADAGMANGGTPRMPVLSRCNSGSPRCNPRVPGHKAPRGPRTFVEPAEFEGNAGEVVEVAYPCAVNLPEGVEVAGVGEWVVTAGAGS